MVSIFYIVGCSNTNIVFRFKIYFKETRTNLREKVYDRFLAVTSECGARKCGTTKTNCAGKDKKKEECRHSTLVYTLPALNEIYICPRMWRERSTMDCRHNYDQITTVLHEMTHAPAVLDPPTDDHYYGSASITLRAEQAFLNADTYSLFARGMFLSSVLIIMSYT